MVSRGCFHGPTSTTKRTEQRHNFCCLTRAREYHTQHRPCVTSHEFCHETATERSSVTSWRPLVTGSASVAQRSECRSATSRPNASVSRISAGLKQARESRASRHCGRSRRNSASPSIGSKPERMTQPRSSRRLFSSTDVRSQPGRRRSRARYSPLTARADVSWISLDCGRGDKRAQAGVEPGRHHPRCRQRLSLRRTTWRFISPGGCTLSG